MSTPLHERVPHYVYRAYDEFETLLYIGCTSHPIRRQSAHRSSSPWGKYVTRWDVEGPYSKSNGYQCEDDAIESEGSIFNCTRADRAASQANRIECRRRLAEKGIPSSAHFDDDAVEAVQNAATYEYVAAMDRMRRSIADTHPFVTQADRMRGYLETRHLRRAAADSAVA